MSAEIKDDTKINYYHASSPSGIKDTNVPLLGAPGSGKGYFKTN